MTDTREDAPRTRTSDVLVAARTNWEAGRPGLRVTMLAAGRDTVSFCLDATQTLEVGRLPGTAPTVRMTAQSAARGAVQLVVEDSHASRLRELSTGPTSHFTVSHQDRGWQLRARSQNPLAVRDWAQWSWDLLGHSDDARRPAMGLMAVRLPNEAGTPTVILLECRDRPVALANRITSRDEDSAMTPTPIFDTTGPLASVSEDELNEAYEIVADALAWPPPVGTAYQRAWGDSTRRKRIRRLMEKVGLHYNSQAELLLPILRDQHLISYQEAFHRQRRLRVTLISTFRVGELRR